MKPRLLLAMICLALCGVIAVALLNRNSGRAPSPVAKRVTQPGVEFRVVRPPSVAARLGGEPKTRGPSETTLAVSNAFGTLQLPGSTTLSAGGVRQGKDPITDPLAREALAWVGFDEEAGAYWVAAINDPTLPAQERQDLIEDLNEDGISDPQHPTLADLPLILNRLDIIEALAPDAMDQVNADAFMEAYRDLVNLAYVAAGAGEPVR